MACNHDHHGHGCHDHVHEESARGQEFSLYQHIDINSIRCLNERALNSCRSVFRPYNERLLQGKTLESDDDSELILYIPFTGSIKLKSFVIAGGNSETAPSSVKMFINRDDIDFSNVSEATPTQEWNMQPDLQASIEYPTRVVKFSSVSSLTMYFPSNFGGNETCITYIGLNGDFSVAARREAVIATYEAKPLPSDHRVKNEIKASSIL